MKKLLSTLALVPCLATTSCIFVEPGNGGNGGNGGGGGSNVQVNIDDHFGDETLVDDMVWDLDTIYINGWVNIESDLTIRCPAKIYMKPGSIITVQSGGNIHANGTGPDCKVVFTSDESTPLPGDWKGIEIIDSAGNTNNFTYTTLEYGGGNEHSMLYINKNVKLSHVTLLDSKSYALTLDDNAVLTEFNDIEIGGMDTRDLIWSTPNRIGELKKFAKDVDDIGRIISEAGVVSLTAGWIDLPAPIVLGRGTDIGGETNSIDVDWKNIEVRLPQDASVTVYKASLDMDNVLVTPYADKKNWNEIRYTNESATSTIKNSTFKDGGSYGNGYLYFEEDALVTYADTNKIENSRYDGQCYYTDDSGLSGIKEQEGNARNCANR